MTQDAVFDLHPMPGNAVLSDQDMLARVQRLEDELLKLPQADIITEHTFLPGFYERKITVPPWCVLTGAAHKTDYRVRLECGTISVNTEDGIKTLTGPLEFDAKAGIKRAGRVYDDVVVWVDIYANPDNCQDLPTIENRLYVVPEIGLGETRKQLALSQRKPELIEA
jgi:hypothetical protein